MATRKVTITLDEAQLDQIRFLVQAGTAPSVSGFVQHAVAVARAPACVSGIAAAGTTSTPAVKCDACGQRLGPGEVEALRGPGARTGPGTAILAQVLGGRVDQQ